MSFKKIKHLKNPQLTRKQLRKQKRQQKKINKNEYYINRKKLSNNQVNVKKKVNYVVNPNKTLIINKENSFNKIPTVEEQRNKECKIQKKLQKEMFNQRKKQMEESNIEEEREIKHLEKKLGFNKRKSKNISKAFTEDGLDYLLQVCDSDTMQSLATEQQLYEIDKEFHQDFQLMTNKKNDNHPKTTNDFFLDNKTIKENIPNESFVDNRESDENIIDSIQDDDEELTDEEIKEESFNEEGVDENKRKRKLQYNGQTWEDIYGRLRASDGTIIKENNSEKYIPPAIRFKMDTSSDTKRLENLNRLKKQLKGLLNRLAESNMHNISNQIEDLFMKNSRNDMNETLTNLILDSLISTILTPERLLMEHIMLIAILHANIGTEIGAYFLQIITTKFNDYYQINNDNIEDKTLDNIITILAQMYNFKLFNANLMYEIMEKLINNINEKSIDCIVRILRNIGFNLRKDNPIALKNFILNLQKLAINHQNNENPRFKFLLDILLAIKNNNVSKIPNYDPSYSEHLNKIIKGFIRKGNYITQLNINLEDLLNVEEKGRWWIIGSAWTTNKNNKQNDQVKTINKNKSASYPEKLLKLAKNQRMNTDTRRDIFCILMSSEDYLDAFEKLLKLGLKNQQEREIIHIILHCCLQEKTFNPFYAILSQKFCDYNRRFQIMIKYSVWDKVKTLNNHSGRQISNLAKLLMYLFIENGLSISTLKIVQFTELDKITLRFMRQILLGILLHDNKEACLGVFQKVLHSDKLKMFKESLRLFIHHFLLRNLNTNDVKLSFDNLPKDLLIERVQLIDKLLISKKNKF